MKQITFRAKGETLDGCFILSRSISPIRGGERMNTQLRMTRNDGATTFCAHEFRDRRYTGASAFYATIFLVAGILAGLGFGQVSPDSSKAQPERSPAYTVETVVVTADRFENKIAKATAAVSVLRAAEIRQLPLAKFADAFQYLPGFFLVDKDGRGRDPNITSRGFYGGGEAEYLVVLVDGQPINDLETGLVNWNLVPINNIERVEISRGASSPLYGDAALGGVINIMTRNLGAAQTEVALDGDALGSMNVGLRSRRALGKNNYQIYGANEISRGFRDHSDFRAATLGGEMTFTATDRSKLWLSTINQWQKRDEPGPLTETELSANREQSSFYYKHDQKDERTHHVQADFTRWQTPRAELKAALFYRFKDGEQNRTFTSPATIIDPQTFSVIGVYDTTQFGDTKQRSLQSNQVGLNLQLNLTSALGKKQNRLSLGFDGDFGHMKNKYHGLLTGFEEDYKNSNATAGAAIADGKHRRWKVAFYLNDALQIFSPLTLTLGGRFDFISDRFDGNLPDTTLESSNRAFSPKVGMNFHYADSSDFAGSIYANVNRSFKAATLDQLSDQRPLDAVFVIPTGPDSYFFLPQTVAPFSNALLKPQKATSYEIGMYQRFELLSTLSGELSLSLYHMNVKDEIDLDLTTFKYGNISRSQHRGLESSVRFYLPRLTTFFNYTLTDVKFESGVFEGNFVKAIPKNVFALGVTYQPAHRLTTSLAWHFSRDAFLDDENTRRLPNFDSGSLRVACSLPNATAFVDVQNLLDKSYSSTGYVVFGTSYFYPAAGRVVRGGINLIL
jgi:outer membrane receptor protein involved in Fe transport